MALNYTLTVWTKSFEELGKDLFRNMGQYLEKRNIHLVECTECARFPEADVYLSRNQLSEIFLFIRLNYTCDFLGFFQVVAFSASPIPSKSSTTDVLRIDPAVLVFLSICGTLCAATAAVVSKPKSKFRTIFNSWLENNWINFSLLFFESSEKLASSWRARVVLTTWLLTALLITVEVSSYLKSSFTVTTYDLIDQYQDAFKYEDVTFAKIFNSPAETVLCSQDENIQYPDTCERLLLSPVIVDILSIPENSRDKSGEKTVFMITPSNLKGVIRKGFNEIRQSGRLFYLGQNPVYVFNYFLVNNWIRRNLFLTENLRKSALVLHETNAWAYENFEGEYMLASILWKKPTEEGTQLFWEDCVIVFNLWLIGNAISCVVFLLEVCSKYALRRDDKTTSINTKYNFFWH